MIELEQLPELTPQGFTACEFTKVITNQPKSIFVDFGDVNHWIPKSVCTVGVDQAGKNKILIKDSKYRELGL